MSRPVLYMMCGKIGAGKSTLAARLGQNEATVVISEDTWLRALFGEQMTTVADFAKYSARLRDIMAPHVTAMLRAGLSVVLDFQANTVASRRWMHDIATEAGATCEVHVLDVPDDICLERLKARNAKGTHAFSVSEEQFHIVAQYFVPPAEDEELPVIWHRFEGSR